MYRIVDENGNVYVKYPYTKEDVFERMVVSNIDQIFGTSGIYFDVKKLIGTPKKGAAIPDGYYLDLLFHDNPRLYFVEVELDSHDVYGHVGEQILRFGICSDTDKYKIKQILLSDINKDTEKKKKLADFFAKSKFDNTNELLDKVVYDNKPATIVVINEATEELSKVLGQLTMATEVIEAQTFVCGDKKLHLFTPYRQEIVADISNDVDADALDTIVVPAREEGFQEEFINNERWYSIRISSTMLEKIKYIAAYQTKPISGITHIAEVERIEKYKDTNKYILYFKSGTVQEIKKIGLGAKKDQAPQAPRYTTYKKIFSSKTIEDVWNN